MVLIVICGCKRSDYGSRLMRRQCHLHLVFRRVSAARRRAESITESHFQSSHHGILCRHVVTDAPADNAADHGCRIDKTVQSVDINNLCLECVLFRYICGMNITKIPDIALSGDFLSFDQALFLYRNAPLVDLMAVADKLRRCKVADERIVTWQIDRNVNITNVCSSGCKFCTFHCRLHQTDRAFITSMEQYREKIQQMLSLGGDQLLLQGGLHPKLTIEYYETLFRQLKSEYPAVKLHALGPPEVWFLAHKAGIMPREALQRLVDAGLDSLPGAGAELLDNDYRHAVSPQKCSADEWLSVMRDAHRMGLLTSATMMYGFRDSDHLRIKHLFALRDLQAETGGFMAFIAWPYQGVEAAMDHQTTEYLRIVAIARLVLTNFTNIQASWLTVGRAAAEMALNGGANDMGSIMIEENVVRSAGVSNVMDAKGMQQTIREAGFIPAQRNQNYIIKTCI